MILINFIVLIYLYLFDEKFYSNINMKMIEVFCLWNVESE